MAPRGWKRLLAGAQWFRGQGRYPIRAYSEFMPPPRVGRKPYARHTDPAVFADDDPWGWRVTEYEEALELRPGLEHIAEVLLHALGHLGRGDPAHGIAEAKLRGNPYWPDDLAAAAGSLTHERYVILLPLALSRSQDDKGRVRWTLYGGSEHGPARAFWQGFRSEPRREPDADAAIDFLRRLLAGAYGEQAKTADDLRHAGLRILPAEDDPHWHEGPLPAWAEPFLWEPGGSLRGVHYLLTFRAFDRLPPSVRRAYLSGDLNLLPFPGSLVYWGAADYLHLAKELPLAAQIPLLHSIPRREAPFGIRVPQSGWLHEPRAGHEGHTHGHGPVRNTYQRTNRWSRVHRDEDELAVEARPEQLLHVLFSTSPDDMGLYGKPMARNVELWTKEFRPVLDGPRADHDALKRAEHEVVQGGLFGYRFQFPAMCVGPYEVYWHRPLAAYLAPDTSKPMLVPRAPTGYLTAYRAERPSPARPVVTLWPRLLHREADVAAVEQFRHTNDPRPHQTTRNVRKVLDAGRLLGPPVTGSLARAMLNVPREETLGDWLGSLPDRAADPERGRWLAGELHRGLVDAPSPDGSVTYGLTSRRSFEVAYWKTIARLAEGRYRNKCNSDCVRDTLTRSLLRHHGRDLEALGDYLIAYYRRRVAVARMGRKALVGDLPFRWETDFDFDWMGGWLKNQKEAAPERDIVLVIPGRDRSRAVIMADHYDTAYEEDTYGKNRKTRGARVAAAGADDNHSATAALMLGAPIFLSLSRAGRLDCDVWLVHLTGEEFPADCLGARHLTELLVERRLRLRLATGGEADLSRVRVDGVCVLDMIAHNNDNARDVFQIASGTSAESMRLALHAHEATRAWNAGAEHWNARPPRKSAGRGRRSPRGSKVPAIARHPQLSGQVRLPYDPRSTLYNTDGQIFSDAGVPVILFMENYDINRQGYHDTHDTMANIDLDYGAAVAAITIESVARAAGASPVPRRRSAKRHRDSGEK